MFHLAFGEFQRNRYKAGHTSDTLQREGYRKSWDCCCMELEYQDAFQEGIRHVVLEE